MRSLACLGRSRRHKLQVLWHGQQLLLPFPNKFSCARAREVKCDDPHCIGLFPYDFENCKVFLILACEELDVQRGQDGDRRVVSKIEVFPLYVDEYRDDGTLLRFAKVGRERYLTSDTDQHGIPNFVIQRRILCVDGCTTIGLNISGDEEEWDFEELVTAKKLERTCMRGNVHEVQDACLAKGWKVPSFVVKIIEVSAIVGAARKEKVALERSGAKLIGDMGKMHTKLDKATLAVQADKVRERTLRAKVGSLKGFIQKNSNQSSMRPRQRRLFVAKTFLRWQ